MIDVALVVLGICLSVVVLSWAFVLPVMMRFFLIQPRLAAPVGTAVPGGADCVFSTADGLKLQGTYLKAETEHPRGVIIFCHELTGNRWSISEYLQGFQEAGFDLFTFDFRNHGQSDRLESYITMPWVTEFEQHDVEAAIDFVAKRNRESGLDRLPIGIFGLSRGGMAALCAASGDQRVKAVVVDGAFPIYPMLRFYLRKFSSRTYWDPVVRRMPDWALFSYCRLCTLLVSLKNRCRFPQIQRRMRKVTQPVFLITGQRDPYIPLSVAGELQNSIKGRAKLWVVPKAGHNQAIALNSDLYLERVDRFFQRYLVEKPRPAKVTLPVSMPATKRPLVLQS